MKHRVWSAAAVVGALLLMASAGCRPNQTVERQTDDAGIKTSIKAKLAADVRFSTLTAVSVDVTNGVVTLAGPVHSAEEKSKIEETVRGIKGVVNVTNNLQVEAGGAAAPVVVTVPVVVTSSANMAPVTTPVPMTSPVVTP